MADSKFQDSTNALNRREGVNDLCAPTTFIEAPVSLFPYLTPEYPFYYLSDLYICVLLLIPPPPPIITTTRSSSARRITNVHLWWSSLLSLHHYPSFPL